MNRRLLILALVVVLFSTFFSLTSPSLSSPSVARAANCTTYSGSYLGIPWGVLSDDWYFFAQVVNVPFSTGDTITATWPGGVGFTPVPGGMDVSLGAFSILATLSNQTAFYTITVCSPSVGGGTSNGANAPLVTWTHFTDGRLNDGDAWATSALYCQSDGSVRVYVIGDPKWTIAFTASPAEIAKVPEHPAQNTLIKSGHGAALYRLTNGLLAVISPGLNPVDGAYHFAFEDCPIPEK